MDNCGRVRFEAESNVSSGFGLDIESSCTCFDPIVLSNVYFQVVKNCLGINIVH